jgi:chemotaxis protein methyltransferase CheR
MTLAPLLDRDGVDWRLLATDISVRALGVAEAGVYEGDKLSRVPGALRKQYFEAHGAPDAPASTYRVKSALRERVVFRRLNLARPPFPISGPLDAIFCRNVMIYFDVPVRQRLVSEMQRVLAPGGLLVIAHAETLSGVEHEFVSVRPSVYRKR